LSPAAACQGGRFRGNWGELHQAQSQFRRHPTAKSGKKKKDAPDREHDNERMIAQNRRARHEYEVMDTLECGIVLVGSEVKSLRAGTLSLDEAYGRVKQGEVWLVGCDIAEYVQSHQFNHEPRRPRKLLMHRREIKKFANLAFEKGLTLVPLKMYFKEGRAKVLLGICRGRKLYDKREQLKKSSMKRDIDRAMRRG
jgi:SsrA-binding protein